MPRTDVTGLARWNQEKLEGVGGGPRTNGCRHPELRGRPWLFLPHSGRSWTGVPMIHFCLAHSAYHLHCRLPRSHWLRLQVTVLLLGIATLVLQFYVLLRPRSSRYCSQPLLANLVGHIILTFFTIGLTVLLTHAEPVPQALRGLFSVLGVGSFAAGVCTVVFTALASDCEKTTPELYYLSVLLSVSSLASTALLSGLGILRLCRVACPRPKAKPTA